MNSPQNNPYGLLAFLHWNHEWNNYHFNEKILPKAIDQIAELGVSMVRMDILWSDIHRGFHKFDFSHYDKIIKLLEEKNIGVLGLLQYDKDYYADGDKEIWNRPPQSFEEFANYVFTTVKRYQSFIHHWEIWNEPNHAVYWAGPTDGLKTYSNLLQISYEAAKKADPLCLVLNGGLTEPIAQDVGHLYQNTKAFDILNIHTFIDPFDINGNARFNKIIGDVLKIMANQNGPEKKIWITEMGCPGIPKDLPAQDWFGGKSMNEDQQADWLETQYSWMKNHPQIEKCFWAFYRDTDKIFNEATDYFGLVRLDLTPKPAFHRMKNLINELARS